MAKNPNNDEDGGILPGNGKNPNGGNKPVNPGGGNIPPDLKNTYRSDFSLNQINNEIKKKRLKKSNILVYSFVAIACVLLISFLIPERYYHRNICILLLNVELLILFTRDIILYFKRSCKMIKAIMSLITFMYVLNCVDLLINIPHSDYVTISVISIVAALCVVYIIGKKE